MKKKSILIVIFSLIFSIFFFLLPVSHVAGQVSVPSIEKLFQDRTVYLEEGGLFYGCIFKIDYEDEDLFTQKSEIKGLQIGKLGRFVDVTLESKHYKGDDGAPKINDCLVFKTKNKIFLQIYPIAHGAKIVKGNFKIEHAKKDTSLQKFKNEISVGEYYEDGLAYGNRIVILEGEVDKIESNKYFQTDTEMGRALMIQLVSSEGLRILAVFENKKWIDNDDLKEKLRSIKVGNVIKVRGYFYIEGDGNQFFSALYILNIVDFGN